MVPLRLLLFLMGRPCFGVQAEAGSEDNAQALKIAPGPFSRLQVSLCKFRQCRTGHPFQVEPAAMAKAPEALGQVGQT